MTDERLLHSLANKVEESPTTQAYGDYHDDDDDVSEQQRSLSDVDEEYTARMREGQEDEMTTTDYG